MNMAISNTNRPSAVSRRLLKRMLRVVGVRDPCRDKMGLREIRPSDRFLVSYPRSGNTWMRFMLAHLIQPGRTISYSGLNAYVPDMHAFSETVNRAPGKRIIKTHLGWFACYPGFVYLVRDGRDVMVSYYHYCIGRGKFEGSFSEFLRSVRPTVFGKWNWSEHVTGALDRIQDCPGSGIVIRYEDMLVEPVQALRKVASLCQIPVSDEKALSEAVDSASFARLKKMERTDGGLKAETRDFFRQGSAGQWRSWFTRDDENYFTRWNGEGLERTGYL